VLASRVTAEERRALRAEHSQLAYESIQAPLDRHKRARLQYLEWHLDRIDDAEIGPVLDMMEQVVATKRDLVERINHLAREVREAAKK